MPSAEQENNRELGLDNSAMNRTEFVAGWEVVHTLGEGAYGEVKLLLNKETHEAVAMKVLDVNRAEDALENIRKEICIHRLIEHEHVIRFYGQRREGNTQYIFLEYASGGELFDRIDPDIGMSKPNAQNYFCQLMRGVEYLHSRGVTHRDLKPENLLLDDNDVLKISDFGLATLFRHQGKERRLTKRCGTVPYMAPEVLTADYRAEPADLWSCAVILVTLLAGELPWDQPTRDCEEYAGWLDCKITVSPWTKLDNMTLSFLRKMLAHQPSRRYNLSQIMQHQWMTKAFNSFEGRLQSRNPITPIKKYRSDHNLSPASARTVSRIGWSQQEALNDDSNNFTSVAHPTSFSQPARPDTMLLSSQAQASGSPASQGTPLQKLVKRLTRFFVITNAEETVNRLQLVAEKFGYVVKRNSLGILTFTMTDRRHMQLIFKASLIGMHNDILVDFRLSKGDGLEFKRQFIKLRDEINDIILKSPLQWSIAHATQQIPS